MTESRRTTTLLALAFAVILTPVALAPIRSYDFFWHLATGRWIVEHHALPLFDPFAVASDRIPWINGEWLFQTLLYGVHSLVAIAWLRAAAVAVLFAAVFREAATDAGTRLGGFLAAIAFAGGYDRLDARPSTAAAAFVAIGVIVLARRSRSADIAFVALTIVWINVHPSALLAPLLAVAARRIHWLPLASAAALLLNPFGIRGVLAPIELTRSATSGAFVNAEWLFSPVTLFPLLYVCVAIGCVAFAIGRRDFWRMLVFALLGYLAIAHVRNQGLFFAAFPMLVAPSLRETFERFASSRLEWLAAAVAVMAVAFVALGGQHLAGLEPGRFPVAATARLRATRLSGNIYNPDQFGGFLIWSFYPERRVLTDGRNELYSRYIPEYGKARLDSRAWHQLLRQYRIDLAVDEYRPLVDTVNPRSGEHRAIAASLAYWPRSEWALIAYDDAAMVFARRAAFPPATVARLELRGVVPDAPR